MDDSRIRSKTGPFSFENGLVWTGPEYVAHVNLLQYRLTREGKYLNFCHYVTPTKPRSHMPSGAFLYVRNSLHSCIYLSFSPILQARDRKFVYRFGARTRKGNCHKSQIFFCFFVFFVFFWWGAWKFPQRNRRTKKKAEKFCHKNSMAEVVQSSTRLGAPWGTPLRGPYRYVLL